MSLHITDEAMTSTTTSHTARRTTGTTTWAVSWLGDRQLTRNQATTAMTLAEFVAAGVTSPAHRHWPHVKNWAAELGLSGQVAVQLAAEVSR